MEHLEVSGAVRPIYESLCVKWLIEKFWEPRGFKNFSNIKLNFPAVCKL